MTASPRPGSGCPTARERRRAALGAGIAYALSARAARLVAIGLVGLVLVVQAAPASANSGTITPNGSPVTATVSVAGQPATFTFSGTIGEVVTASTLNGTFASNCDATINVLNSSGHGLSSGVCAGTSGLLGEITLPSTGTYKLELDSPSNTGKVTLYLARDATGSITANGAPVTFTSVQVGQSAQYTFSGTIGEVVTASTLNGTFASNCDATINVLNSSGNGLAPGACAGISGLESELTLPRTGIYTVDINVNKVEKGKVTLYLARDATGSITANGAPVTFTSVQVGQSAQYTFSGTIGEVVTASTLNGTFASNCDATINVLNSSGNGLAPGACAGISGLESELTLPRTGIYTVDINVNKVEKGKVTLYLARDATGSITANGAPVTFTSVQVGQSAQYTFSGTIGEVVTASTLNGTFASNCDATINVLNSSGNGLAPGACAGISGLESELTLPRTGIYTVDINVNKVEKGKVTLYLARDATGSITANGAPVTFTSVQVGQSAQYTFSGTIGEVVTASTLNGTFASNCDATINVLNSSGNGLAPGACAGISGLESELTLPRTGIYTVDINVNKVEKGKVTVELKSP